MSMQAEQEVIASMLMEPHLAKECALTATDFCFSAYREIYRAIQDKTNAGQGFDVVTLGEHLQNKMPEQQAQEIWETVVSITTNSLGSPALFQDYCESVKRDARLRDIQLIATRLNREVTENKDATAADRAISELMALDSAESRHAWTLEETVKSSLQSINDIAEQEGLVGIDTGISLLNDATGGLQDSDLIVIGARPSVGKTALMLNIANSAAKSVPVGIISAEQPNVQLGKRLFSIEGSLDAQKIRIAQLDEEFVNGLGRTSRRLMERHAYINDKPGIQIAEVCRQAREWVHKYGVKALFVDYLQKINGSDSRQSAKEKAAEVVSALKNIARELCIPVIALAQVNRDVDKRPDARPNMGDLSNAGEIEMEADLVMMLYRDEVYDEETPDKGIAELLLEKNRHGPTGRIKTAWVGQYMQFNDLTMRSDADNEAF